MLQEQVLYRRQSTCGAVLDVVVYDLGFLSSCFALRISLPLHSQKHKCEGDEYPVADVRDECTHSSFITPAEDCIQDFPNTVFLLVTAVQLPQEVFVVSVLLQLMHGAREKTCSNEQEQHTGSQQEPLEPDMAATFVEQVAGKDATKSTDNCRNGNRCARAFQSYTAEKDHRFYSLSYHNAQGKKEERILASLALHLCCTGLLLVQSLERDFSELLLPFGSPCIHSEHGKRHHRDKYHSNETKNPFPQRLRILPRVLRDSVVEGDKDRRRQQRQRHARHDSHPHMPLHAPPHNRVVHDLAQENQHNWKNDGSLQRLPEKNEERRHTEELHHGDPDRLSIDQELRVTASGRTTTADWMSWRKKIKLQGLSRAWRVFIVQFERSWRRGIMRALRSSDGDGRKECSAAAVERRTGNNATRKGRRTGAMQRSGNDGDGRAHVERRAEVVRIYGKGQGACTVQYGMVPGVCELGVLWSVHARG